MAYISGSHDIMVAKTISITEAGKTIVQNATDLGTWAQKILKAFEANLLPPCLNQMAVQYGEARETEFANLSQRRLQIGQLLQKASSLIDFNEQALQTVFQGMNLPAVPDSQKQNIGTDLTSPNGFGQLKGFDRHSPYGPYPSYDPHKEQWLLEQLDGSFDLQKLHQLLGNTSKFGTS